MDSLTDQQEIPLGICEELFSTFFKHITFREWHSRRGCWQLRVIGPPGSGKTILSALTAQYLRQHFKEKSVDVAVAAVFVKRRVAPDDDHDFLRKLLANVLMQLQSQSGQLERPLSELTLEDLETALQRKISSLERTFLIVDDVDACDRALGTVKTELQHLQQLGLKIMVTSRIPLNFETDVYGCDSMPEVHGITPVYWACRDCYVRDDVYDADEALLVCHECKANGRPCPNCGRPEYLHEPYASVDVNLPAIIGEDVPTFEGFLARELELAHGDLGLESKIDKPPNSMLGKEIRTTSFNPYSIIYGIAEAVNFNIALAKVRLSTFQEAQTIQELERTKDRLPLKFIMVFEAGISRILQQSESDKMLGLVALDLVSEPKEQIPFKELQGKLAERGLLEIASGQDLRHNLSRVLHATCGFIKVELKEQLWVEPFHHLFGQFILDNYSEELAQARSYRVVRINGKC